ncbi:MAG: DUF2189 domain-containing protein [Gammaproteobacteria bacterium]|nr:DUF2189 domain-containing protein [Gammaproteobacteria bacterium]
MSESPVVDPAAAEALPFVAPCRRLAVGAPLRWLRLGWADMRAAPLPSLAFGLAILALSLTVTGVAYRFGTGWLVIVLLSSFIFVAPVLAIGLYAISASLERGRRPSFGRCLAVTRARLGDMLLYSLILMVISLVWVRAGSAVEIFFPTGDGADFVAVATFFAIGTAVGTLFSIATFAASAFSLPMLVDRHCDAVTGVVTSVNAVLRNKPAMLVWATLIVLSVAVGFATGLLGLAVTMPLIGHATWHAYRETIDAAAWPVHPDPTPPA